MDDLIEFIEYICDILKMPVVELKVITVKKMVQKAGKDSNGCYDREDNCIYMPKKKKYDLHDYFILSHEIRHAWQQYTDPQRYFNDYYVGMDESTYHLIDAEIDANAFATIAIAIGFCEIAKVTYKDDPEANKKYNQRLNELMDEFGIIIEELKDSEKSE